MTNTRGVGRCRPRGERAAESSSTSSDWVPASAWLADLGHAGRNPRSCTLILLRERLYSRLVATGRCGRHLHRGRRRHVRRVGHAGGERPLLLIGEVRRPRPPPIRKASTGSWRGPARPAAAWRIGLSRAARPIHRQTGNRRIATRHDDWPYGLLWSRRGGGPSSCLRSGHQCVRQPGPPVLQVPLSLGCSPRSSPQRKLSEVGRPAG